MTHRTCGECSLCCKLLPMSARVRDEAHQTGRAMVEAGWLSETAWRNSMDDFDKKAGDRCPFQRRSHKGCCKVYAVRPLGCRVWTCRWLVNDDTNAMSRPDRAGYVIDSAPDYVRSESGQAIPVFQIWVDPDRRDAINDPRLQEYMVRRAKAEGVCFIIRFNADEDCVFMYEAGGRMHTKRDNLKSEGPHSALDKAKALSGRNLTLHVMADPNG